MEKRSQPLAKLLVRIAWTELACFQHSGFHLPLMNPLLLVFGQSGKIAARAL